MTKRGQTSVCLCNTAFWPIRIMYTTWKTNTFLASSGKGKSRAGLANRTWWRRGQGKTRKRSQSNPFITHPIGHCRTVQWTTEIRLQRVSLTGNRKNCPLKSWSIYVGLVFWNYCQTDKKKQIIGPFFFVLFVSELTLVSDVFMPVFLDYAQ